MIALLALTLALARPPVAYLDTGETHVPLAISSWCLGRRCGAPIASARRVATVRRGGIVRCVLAFSPERVTVSVGGVRVAATRDGDGVEWRARRAGGVTITATVAASAATDWVTYVGRLKVR